MTTKTKIIFSSKQMKEAKRKILHYKALSVKFRFLDNRLHTHRYMYAQLKKGNVVGTYNLRMDSFKYSNVVFEATKNIEDRKPFIPLDQHEEYNDLSTWIEKEPNTMRWINTSMHIDKNLLTFDFRDLLIFIHHNENLVRHELTVDDVHKLDIIDNYTKLINESIRYYTDLFDKNEKKYGTYSDMIDRLNKPEDKADEYIEALRDTEIFQVHFNETLLSLDRPIIHANNHAIILNEYGLFYRLDHRSLYTKIEDQLSIDKFIELCTKIQLENKAKDKKKVEPNYDHLEEVKPKKPSLWAKFKNTICGN